MGSAEDFALALAGPQTQQAIKAENPYYTGENTTDAMTNQAFNIMNSHAQQRGRTPTIGEALIPALVGGLASGIFKGYGDQYQNTLTDRYQKTFNDLNNGVAVTPESSNLPPSLFNSARNANSIWQLQQKLSDKEDADKIANQVKLQTDLIPAEVERAKQVALATADIKGQGARANANTIKVADELGSTISAIAALNDNAKRIQGLEGDDSMLGLAQRAAARLDPSSKTSQYIKGLPFLADPVTVGLSKSSKMGTLNKTLEGFHPDIGQTKGSMLDINDQAKQAMIDKSAKYLDMLTQLGYPTSTIQSLKDKLDAATTGELIDDNYLKSRQSFGAAPAISPSFDPQVAQKEAAALSAQGMKPADVAATLRAKYGAGN